MKQIVFSYITAPNKKTACKITKNLLEKRLAACINMFSIESQYLWKGKIEKSREFVIIAKTTEEKFKELKKEVERIHPYEIPCVCKTKVEANKKFFDWVHRELK